MVFGPRVIEAIDRGDSEAKPTGAMRAVIDDGVPDLIAGRTIDVSFTASSSTAAPRPDARERLQRAMTTGAGVLRSASSLAETALVVDEVMGVDRGVVDVGAAETHNLAMVSTASSRPRRWGAAERTRSDFPARRHVARAVRAAMTDVPLSVIHDAVARALAEDLGPLGDITAALLDPDELGHASFVPRRPGVIAGTACATEAFRQVDTSVVVQWGVVDGDRVAAGDVIGTVEGPLAPILTAERTALNFLCHLSGSDDRPLVDRRPRRSGSSPHLTPAAIPGPCSKAAVRSGGGVNPGSLSEMVLVKRQPPGRLGMPRRCGARERWPDAASSRVRTDRAVIEAADSGADLVMLDNMPPEDVAKCVAVVDGRAVVEVSGGVTIETVARYASTGADLISSSAITQSAPAFDIGLDLDG
jgi:nicotinate-nucleotide pyrophosphorylase (carboxylating)